jgi:diketogulonate reductase-like aldo/keto reductase
MKLISLKRSKKETKELNTPKSVGSDDDGYPWGTRLNFEKDIIDKIKALQTITAGTEVKIQAIGYVSNVSTSESAKGPEHQTVEIQIQQIEIKDNTNAEASFDEN